MPQKRYTAEQIIPMLRRADVELGQGKKIPEVSKLLEITQQTYLPLATEVWRRDARDVFGHDFPSWADGRAIPFQF